MRKLLSTAATHLFMRKKDLRWVDQYDDLTKTHVKIWGISDQVNKYAIETVDGELQVLQVNIQT